MGDAKRGNTGTLVLTDAGEAEASASWRRARPRRVVVASRQGVTRSGEFAFLFRKGALDGARGVEGAAKLALQKIGEGGETWSAWARRRARLGVPSWRSATRATRLL